jgi:hypothetical protein
MTVRQGFELIRDGAKGKAMIRTCVVSGDLVRHDDGRLALVMSWQGMDDKREVCLAIRDGADHTFARRWYPMQFFMNNFTFVRKLEENG